MKNTQINLLKASILAVLLLVPGQTNATNTYPPKYIRGSLVCAINVNKFRAKLGLKQTHSASAASFMSLRRTNSPRPGAAVVNRRPGGWHAQVFDGMSHGVRMCWNASSVHGRWVYQSCNATWRNKVKGYYQ